MYVLVSQTFHLSFFPFLLLWLAATLHAQSSAGTITGTVNDASGAVVPGATVASRIRSVGFRGPRRQMGRANINSTICLSIPITCWWTRRALLTFTADVLVRSTVPVTPAISLQVGGASTTVTVTGDDLVENDSSLHATWIAPDGGAAAGKPVVLSELAGDALVPRRFLRFQWTFPWARRSCLQLVFRRWPADHRPAEQGFLQPDPLQFHSID